jgi:hypothetical protein
VGEDNHEEDGVGGEVLELKTELLQEQKEEGGDRGASPQVMYALKSTNSPATGSLRELENARIFSASSGMVHPKRLRTASSCSWRWKWQG